MSDEDLDEAPLDRHGWVAEQPEHCGPQADGSFVLALEHEIQLGQSGDPTTELRFRQPKGKDWMSFPTDPKEVGDLLRMAARLTGRPLAELQQLEGVDVRRVLEVVGFLMAGSPEQIGSAPTGGWPSI